MGLASLASLASQPTLALMGKPSATVNDTVNGNSSPR
jgi:hypothetical protein